MLIVRHLYFVRRCRLEHVLLLTSLSCLTDLLATLMEQLR